MMCTIMLKTNYVSTINKTIQKILINKLGKFTRLDYCCDIKAQNKSNLKIFVIEDYIRYFEHERKLDIIAKVSAICNWNTSEVSVLAM